MLSRHCPLAKLHWNAHLRLTAYVIDVLRAATLCMLLILRRRRRMLLTGR